MRELTVKCCIENNIERMKGERYKPTYLKDLDATIREFGFEATETIDKFLECVALEARDRGIWNNSALILLDIVRTPKCKDRLYETIHIYGEFVHWLIIFLKKFDRDNDIEQISKIVFKHRKTHYLCFETFMYADIENAIRYYYSYFNELPNALFFRKMEAKYTTNFSVARAGLEACMEYILKNEINKKAEEKFWNENLQLMLEFIPRSKFSDFLTNRYMLLVPNLEFMNPDVQETVLKRIAKRDETRIFKDGYTRLIAYYIIGKCMDSKSCVTELIARLENTRQLVDWNELVRIFNIAYEDVDSYEVKLKEKMLKAYECSKEALKRKRQKDFEEFLAMIA